MTKGASSPTLTWASGATPPVFLVTPNGIVWCVLTNKGLFSIGGMSMFDAKAELEKIRLNRVPKNQYYKSRLDPFTNELLELKKAGASIAEIHFFLKERKVNVTWCTVNNWMNKHYYG